MNKKGFLTIIIILAIFSIGSIIILNNQINHIEVNYSDGIVNTKNKVINYSLVLNQSAQKCFSQIDTLSCIDSNSNLIISQLNLDKEPYNCIKPTFNLEAGGEVKGKINCNYLIYTNNELIFENKFSYDIIVREAN